MPLSDDFPLSPFEILDPEVRWYPGKRNLSELGRAKLLPPLVTKLRKEVYEWRKDGYKGVSDSTHALLNYWFKTPHENGFEYFFAQRESVESIVYLYEVANIRNPTDLLKYDSSDSVVGSMFEEQWPRLVIKQATGTGKTKVISLLLAWSYFHKSYIDNSELSKNFLIIAPNTIVLDRLKTDIDGLKIFYSDPVIPPNNYEGISWQSDFNLRVHIQDNIGTLNRNGNIFLTNVQRFTHKQGKQDEDSSVDYFLGNKPVTQTTANKITVKDIVNNIEDLVVMNDEAHHIHDSGMAWYKTIETIHHSLLQKGHKLSLQLDTTATPKHTDGNIFIQTVADYPLVEAITQEVVKKPVLPDDASRGKLKEQKSSKFTERYRDYLNLGYILWKQDFEKHKKLGKKALLFIMVDDTKNCDEVKDYIESTFPLLKGGTFVIHTKNNGEIDEATSSKSQTELARLRKLSNQVDEQDNNIKAIISVLMLKEGWDVQNVTTIVGLRPYSTKSNILPEQTLGRGLRRMYFGEGISEELNVVGTDNFLDFVDSIKSEGVILEKRSMGTDSPPSGPLIIEVDKENPDKDLEKLEIEIPIFSPRLQRNYINLDELKPKEFDFKEIDLKEISEDEQGKNLVFRDFLSGEFVFEIKLDESGIVNSTSVITFFTQALIKELRLFGVEDFLYGKLKQFIKHKLFGKTVDLDDINVIRNLTNTNVLRLIIEIFKKNINELTIVDIGSTEVLETIKATETKTFSVRRTHEYLKPRKSVFNTIVGDSHYELEFAGFLDAAVDVTSFYKNYIQLQYKIAYIKYDGGIGNYHPDFVVKLTSGECWVVETKGAENLNDPKKIERLKVWCEDATRGTGTQWRHLYVRQEEWNKLDPTPNSFSEIIGVFSDLDE